MKVKQSFFLAALCACLMLALFGCSLAGKPAVPKAVTQNLAELRTNLYAGDESRGALTVIMGQREVPYKVDGAAGKLTPYAVVTYAPPTVVPSAAYRYKLTADGKTYEGAMELHPMGQSYAADAKTELTAKEITVVITRTDDNAEERYTLTGRHADQMLTWEDAVTVTMEKLSEPLSALYDGKKLTGEVFVKFTNEPADSDNYYWYVSFTDGTKTIAALVDARNGQVIASRMS
jgi:hypothetical protein